MGLWEDAQAQSNATQNDQANLDRMRAEAAQNEQRELVEFVDAMNKLNIGPQRCPLYYNSSTNDAPPGWDGRREIKKHPALGWPITTDPVYIVTTEARIIRTDGQYAPTGFLGKNFTTTFAQHPFISKKYAFTHADRFCRDLNGEELGWICNAFDYHDYRDKGGYTDTDRYQYNGKPLFTPLSEVLRVALAHYMRNR